MDIESLKELLSEYLFPVGTINWTQFLLDSLPSIVTIFTVITTTIIQLRNSKNETKRFMSQLEQQKELERIRHEEERKRIILENQLKSQEKLQFERIATYTSLLESLYCNDFANDTERAYSEALAKSAKLLSLCDPSDRLAAEVHSLVTCIESTVIPGNNITKQDICTIKSYASSIALYLNNPNFGRPVATINNQPEQ